MSALDPLKPCTGSLQEEWSTARNAQIVEKLAEFDTIYIYYTPHIVLHGVFDFLVKSSAASMGQPQRGLRVIAPSGSGKTTAALRIKALIEAKLPEDCNAKPIVYVALERQATSRRLFSSILNALGDGFHARGTEDVLRERVYKLLQRFKTLLLIIDEVQHLSSRGTGGDVTDSLKRLLDDGVVSVVFMGVEEALPMFTRNLQLSGRLLPPADIRQLDSEIADDRSLLADFIVALDKAVVERGLMEELGGWEDPWIVGCLHNVCDGVIGRIVRLVRVALEIALRRGASRIEPYDLMLATDRWAVPQNFVKANPFLSRLREV
ncbi:TniB family NTP-binding protein [Caulobacter segnis]|uniref:TniB family NTP-binding protein n=1 Tax=Caulobacter segnis TaxID=88688 RepID=UPI001CBE0CB1|nr:TniB family NTP-binding protein [Caulobacter segnis]UAL10101.1 TniB family NTP-binding protein [Caulobacter segnis]